MTNLTPKIAVVENDPALLRAIERLLRACGYDTEIFKSAEDFLQRPNEARLDCLLLDINLDGISGIELQKILVKKAMAPPIIFITGQADEATFAQAIDLGCIAFLHKPFESRSLWSALTAALESGLQQKSGTENNEQAAV